MPLLIGARVWSWCFPAVQFLSFLARFSWFSGSVSVCNPHILTFRRGSEDGPVVGTNCARFLGTWHLIGFGPGNSCGLLSSLVSTRGTFSAGEQVTGMEMEIGIAGGSKARCDRHSHITIEG